jgi:hypothetical protein
MWRAKWLLVGRSDMQQYVVLRTFQAGGLQAAFCAELQRGEGLQDVGVPLIQHRLELVPPVHVDSGSMACGVWAAQH